MKHPYLSVIVPNYNHEKYLVERINSILFQTYQNFEIILLDDASTDKSRDIIKCYEGNPKISTILFNENNSGAPVKQWCKGIHAARGELVWIAESDDTSSKYFLETLISRYYKKKSVITYCHSLITDESSNVIDEVQYNHEEFTGDRWKKDFYNNGQDEIRKYLVHRNTIPNVSSALIEKKQLRKVLSERVDYYGAADWYVYINLLSEGDIQFISKPLNYFREHSQSTRAFSDKKNDIRTKERLQLSEYMKDQNWISNEEYSRIVRRTHQVMKDCISIKSALKNFIVLLSKFKKVTLWGYSPLTRIFINAAKSEGVKDKIIQVIDRRASGKNWFFYEIPILAVDQMQKNGIEVIFIISDKSENSIRNDIQETFSFGMPVISLNEL